MARYAKNSVWPCLPLDTPMTDTLWSLDQHYQQTGGKRETIYTLPYTILGPVKGWHTVLTNIECEAMWLFLENTHLVHSCTPRLGGTPLENSGTPWCVQYTQLRSTVLDYAHKTWFWGKAKRSSLIGLHSVPARLQTSALGCARWTSGKRHSSCPIPLPQATTHVLQREQTKSTLC